MAAERLERNTWTVSVLTLASRMTGLARDAALSRCFGIGPVMDALAFAFMLPNLFRRLFGEGALSAAFLPVYARLESSDRRMAGRVAALLVALLTALLGGLTLVGELILWGLAETAGADNLTLRLMMITLPYMPLVCLVAILGAMLQVHGRFGPPIRARRGVCSVQLGDAISSGLCVVVAALNQSAPPDSTVMSEHREPEGRRLPT